MTNRQLFLNHVGQTSAMPLCLEIVKAEGCRLYDINGKEYIDLIGGISVCNVGHRHPKVIEAIKKQLEDYLHIMVYGELVQSPHTRSASPEAACARFRFRLRLRLKIRAIASKNTVTPEP